MSLRRIALIALVGLLVAACGAEPGEPTTTTTADGSSTTTPAPTTTSPGPSDRVQKAVDDLATRLEVTSDRIVVVSDEDVTWGDGSIGCPKPGVMYTQALVDGYRVVLSVDDTEYRYHGATGAGPFYCQTGLNPG